MTRIPLTNADLAAWAETLSSRQRLAAEVVFWVAVLAAAAVGVWSAL